MQSAITSIESLSFAMREALDGKDWDAISILDSQCRLLIGKHAGNIEVPIREQIEALSRLYLELRQAASVERERIAGELTRLNQVKQVDQAYKSFG